MNSKENTINNTEKTTNNAENTTKNIITAVIVAAVLIGGSFIYMQSPNQSGRPGKTLSSSEVSDKIVNFINSDLLQGQGTAVALETTKENNLYKIKISIDGKEFDSYVTLDGKILFPEAIFIDAQ